MKIGIDVSMIDSNKAGIGYYAYSLLKAFAKVDSVNEYYLFTYNKDLLLDIELPENFKIIEVAGKGNLQWMFKCLPIIKQHKVNRFLSPSNLFWGCILNNCTTVIHDIAQILHPAFFYKKGNFLYRLELKRLLARKGNVIVPSNAVKTEILANYKNIQASIDVVKEGVHDWVLTKYSKDFEAETIKKYNLPNNYILSVGTLEPRKNLVSVILGFKEFVKQNSDYKLVIVGKKGWFYDEIYKTVEKHSLQGCVIFLGYVPDSDLPVIYDSSKFVVSLSFYEGFGLPLIEASGRGKLVLASDIPVYRELDLLGLYIKPTSNEHQIAEAMSKVLSLEYVYNPQFFDTYSWKNAARKLLSMWE